MEKPKVRVFWTAHKNAITSYFERLFNEGINFDCTFAAEGRIIRGHQNLISACSPYFEQLLAIDSEKNKHPIIVLTCSFKHLEQLFNFMYHGEVVASEDEIPDLLQVAENLQIRGLDPSSCKMDTDTDESTTDDATDDLGMSDKLSPPTGSIENVLEINENLVSTNTTLGSFKTKPIPPPPSIIPQCFIKSSLLPTSQILSRNDFNSNSNTIGTNTFNPSPKIFTPSLSQSYNNLINNNNTSSEPEQHNTSLNGPTRRGAGAKKRKASLNVATFHTPIIKRGRGRPRKVKVVPSPVDKIPVENNVNNNNNFIPTPTSTQSSAAINWNNTSSIYVDKAVQISLNEPSLITLSDESDPETADSSKSPSPQLQSTLTSGHENREENQKQKPIKKEPGALNNEQLSGSDERKFKCDSCFKTYKYNNWLKFHLKNESTQKCFPKYKCNFCNKRKRQAADIRKHQSKCKGGKKKIPATPTPTHNESEALIANPINSKGSFAGTIDDLINAAGVAGDFN